MASAKATTPPKGRATPPAPRTARERSGKGKAAQKANDVTFALRMSVPGREEKVDVKCALREMTLRERDDVRRAMARLTDPDVEDWAVVHGWIFLKRIPEYADVRLDDLYDMPWGQVLEHIDLGDLPEVTLDPEA